VSFQSLTVVLPAYNEEERLGSALDELFAYLRGVRDRNPSDVRPADVLPPHLRVLIVDDGSTDGTAEVATAAVQRASAQGVTLDVLTVPHGGKGAAVRAGMIAADGDVIVFADADMATPPDQLPSLVAALESADAALGSRIQPDGSDMRASQPRYRRLIGRVFHLLVSMWVAGPVADTQCGFKGFRRDVAHDVFARQRIGSIVFDVEIIYLCRRRGYRLAVGPIQWADRRGSRMKMRPGLAMSVAWDLLRIPVLHRGVERPPGTAAERDPRSGTP
jgi:glycosyltransferase involved in cell wall biosynthesis